MPRGRRFAQNAAASTEAEALEARPKRRRTRKTDDPAPLSDALDEIVSRIPGLTTADQLQLPAPAAELPPPQTEVVTSPERESIRRPEIGADIAPEPENNGQLSYAERTRPDGPRKREPGEPRNVFVSLNRGFRLDQEGVFRKFRFENEPPEEWKNKLRDARFHYVPKEKAWIAAASYEIRDASDRLALEFAGKGTSQSR